MSLVTNIGASNSNSYVNLDVARQITARVCSATVLATWDALTDLEKEYRLTLAAMVMGLLPLRGRKVYKNQALSFPRTLLVPRETTYARVYDGTKYIYSDQVIYGLPDDDWQPETDCRRVPDEVKDTQCEIAAVVIDRMITTGGGTGSSIGTPSRELDSVNIEGLSVSLGKPLASGNLMDQIYSATLPMVYLRMQKWISQFRGGAIGAIRDLDFYVPCETLPTTTTTTSTTSTSTSTSTSTTTV